MEKLKECPCCKGRANKCCYQEEIDRWEIYCLSCGLSIVKHTETETIQSWNTRATQSQGVEGIVEELEKVRDTKEVIYLCNRIAELKRQNLSAVGKVGLDEKEVLKIVEDSNSPFIHKAWNPQIAKAICINFTKPKPIDSGMVEEFKERFEKRLVYSGIFGSCLVFPEICAFLRKYTVGKEIDNSMIDKLNEWFNDWWKQSPERKHETAGIQEFLIRKIRVLFNYAYEARRGSDEIYGIKE